MGKDREKVLTIEPNKIPEGTCIIKESLLDKRQRFSICKEKGKIKIFPVINPKVDEND